VVLEGKLPPRLTSRVSLARTHALNIRLPLRPSFRSSFLEKAVSSGENPTNTPDVLYTEDLIYSMSNVTHLVGAEWLMGLAFSNSTIEGQANAMEVVAFVEDVLGSSLIGYQVGNEPDL
jgi:hypothetical protein